MAKQDINIGEEPNDGTGDPIRTAFGKAVANFNELYAAVAAAVASIAGKADDAATTAALAAKADGTATTAALAGKADGAATTAALALKADLASPAFTGNPTATTQAAGNNTTRIATTGFVEAARLLLVAALGLKADKADTWRVLAKSNVAVAHTGTTAQTDVILIPIPAGALGPNGKLRVDLLMTCNNNANQKMNYLRLGGATMNASNIANTSGMRIHRVIVNVNNAAVQKTMPSGSGSFGSSTGALQTGAVNTAVAQDLQFTCLLANAADNITIEEYTVEILYGA